MGGGKNAQERGRLSKGVKGQPTAGWKLKWLKYIVQANDGSEMVWAEAGELVRTQ